MSVFHTLKLGECLIELIKLVLQLLNASHLLSVLVLLLARLQSLGHPDGLVRGEPVNFFSIEQGIDICLSAVVVADILLLKMNDKVDIVPQIVISFRMIVETILRITIQSVTINIAHEAMVLDVVCFLS